MNRQLTKISIRECTIAQKGIKPKLLKNEPFAGSVPYLDIAALETGQIRAYTLKELGTWSTQKDVLVVWDGSRSGLPLQGMEGVIGSTIMALTPIGLESDYLFYFLCGKYEFLNKNSTGSGIPHVDSQLFMNMEIPLIPLGEQRRLINELQAKIEQNKTLLKHHESTIFEALSATEISFEADRDPVTSIGNFRKAVLNSAFAGELTRHWRQHNNITHRSQIAGDFEPNNELKKMGVLPLTWQWTSIGNLAICKRGRFNIRPRNDPKYFNGQYPFIQIGDIPEEGGIILNYKQSLNEEGARVSKMFEEGTVVIAIVGSSIGNSGILGRNMYFPDSIVGMNVTSKLNSNFLALYLQNEKEEIRNLSYSSGGQPNLKIEFINNYPIPCPPLEEQQEIVRRVEALFGITEKVKVQYQNALLDYTGLENSLLQEAFDKEHLQDYLGTFSNADLLTFLAQEKARTELEKKGHAARQSKARKTMANTTKETVQLDIEDILKANNGISMSAKDVWHASKYSNIVNFYEAIKIKVGVTIKWELTNTDEIEPLSMLSLI